MKKASGFTPYMNKNDLVDGFYKYKPRRKYRVIDIFKVFDIWHYGDGGYIGILSDNMLDKIEFIREKSQDNCLSYHGWTLIRKLSCNDKRN